MKLFIISPNTDTQLSQEHRATLQVAGSVTFEDEKNPFGHYEGNVWNGPALGWCTNESMTKNADQWVEAIVTAAKGEYPTKVN